VSVCIPSCEGAAVIGDAIESALGQRRPPDEVLIVDDASTDDTVAVCRSFRAPQVRVVENPVRLGLVGNHNRVVALARSPWVKLLGQDDLLLPTCLEQMVGAATPSASIVVCGRRYEHLTGEALAGGYVDAARRAISGTVASPTTLTPATVGRWLIQHGRANTIGEPVAVLARRDAVLAGGGFDGRFVQLWDYERWLRLAADGGLVVVPEELVVFRAHGASASNANHQRSLVRTRAVDPLLLAIELARSTDLAPLRAGIPAWRWYGGLVSALGRAAYRTLWR
jgi:glycosyltransferase involved in cell wall biosynthesis